MSIDEERLSIPISTKGESKSVSLKIDGGASKESSKSGNTEDQHSEKLTNDAPEVLKNELEAEKKKNADLSKRMLYLQADYANLQRLSEKRVSEAKDETKLRFVEELISLKEDLERAMSIAKVSTSSILFDGLSMMLSRIEGILRSEEVERINAATGSVFDPRLHEAVAYSEGNSEKEGTIVSVVSNGYTMRGKVIKPALVEVSRQNVSTLENEQVKVSPNDKSSLETVAKQVNEKDIGKEQRQVEVEIRDIEKEVS
jgi:molecular chaperone GrpE